MSKRVAVFVVFVLGSAIACGSDPAPAPVSPSTSPTVAGGSPTSSPPVGQTTPPVSQSGGTASTDIIACLGHLDPKAVDACKGCMATSCLDPIKTVGAACPDFSRCVCDGRPMLECAPSLMAPGCAQAGMAVGMCMHQSCAAQCPLPVPTAATAPGMTSPGAAAGASAGDPCGALSACCAQVPGGAPASCAQVVGTKNTQACGSLLTAFRNMNKCH